MPLLYLSTVTKHLNMKPHLFLLVFVMFTGQLIAQTPQWQWVQQGGSNAAIGNDQRQRINDMVVDEVGNVYVTGIVAGLNIPIGDTVYQGVGSADVFVAKYNCEGKLEWADVAGGNGIDRAGGIALDDHGNVYMNGRLGTILPRTIRFGGKDYTIGSTATSFVAKYTNSGQIIDVFFGENNVLAWFIRKDSQGNLFTYNSGNGGTFASGLHYPASGFVVKFDTLLNVLSLDSIMPQQSGLNVQGCVLDEDDNIYLVGYFSDTLILADTLVSVNPGSSSGFFAKFDAAGNAVWARQLNLNSNHALLSIVAHNNSVYVSGYYFGIFIFKGDTIAHTTNTTPPVVVKYTADGDPVWAKPFHLMQYTGLGSAIAVKGDRLVVTGDILANAWVDSVQLPHIGAFGDLYIVLFDTLGNALEGHTLVVDHGSSGNKSENAGFDQAGNVYIGGFFNGWIIYGDDSLQSRNSFFDFFLAKFGVEKCDTLTGTGTPPTPHALRLWPNPAPGTFHIEGELPPGALLQVYDMAGRTVHAQQLHGPAPMQVALPIATPPGLYLTVVFAGTEVWRGKVVVE